MQHIRAGDVLQRVDLSQEAISKICDVPGVYWGGSWSSDGRILFVLRDVGIFQVPSTGGALSQIAAVGRAQGEFSQDYPQALHGGRFLYGTISTATGAGSRDYYGGSLTKPGDRVRLLTNVIDP